MGMATLEVLPAKDGHDMRSNWMLHKDGSMLSTHVKKSAAMSKMRRKAKEGDRLIAKKTNGQIQTGYPKTYQGSRSSDSEKSSAFGIPGFGNPGYGEGTLKENDLF